MKPRRIAQIILILLTYLLIMAIFTSCAPMRKVKTTSTIDSTGKTEVITTRKVDTLIKIPTSTVTGSKPLDNLIKGDSLVTENNQVRVAVKIDPATGNVTATGTVKPVEVPVQINERREERNEVAVTKKEEHKEKEPDSGFAWAWIMVLLLLIMFAFCFEYIRRRVMR